MRVLLTLFLCLPAVGLALATFLALWPTNLWWVRMTDFPRLQYGIGLCATLLVVALARPVSGRLRMGLAGLILVALAYNAVKLVPYLPRATSGTRSPVIRSGNSR